ncbi:protein-glutamine gamma-glutamyltransferase 2 [Cololabis saira]|uniref:protein-glutamine gamma-glutamyltransferase 2 n=1 Tax=Cololabis saira TaxID=129043 RepID=UPI002AD54A83|nr:protein-glutamine gamma-glutamyltransferase 2 [Cololabis saira]
MASHNGLITAVDLRSRENNYFHGTREIDRQRLIVRRGQPFSIIVRCSKALTPKHHLELVLHLGKHDEVVIKVQKERRAGDKWWFTQQWVQDEILLTLHSPADAIIGQYRMAVLVMSPDGRIEEDKNEVRFFLLFNPLCRDDVVHLPDEYMLHEYIRNENGIIYNGTSNNIGMLYWNYGQFEDKIMDICFEILDNSNDALKNSKMDLDRRGDPVYVSRTITAMVNADDDRGVVIGKWSGSYSDGTSPSSWTSSVPILREWSKAGARGVKYGQCWVFAGVACTVLRCLGIPTRVITNFNSAHDTHKNLSIDYLVGFENENLGDSIWNFHVWVESWMRRDDLPKGNDGWQVLDPTPQEQSESGMYCCGPCPVIAIKEGELGAKYDAPFIFAEVNADIIHWRIQPDGQWGKVIVDKARVGKNISTKSIYGDYKDDVTLDYKYPEGSQKEREVFEKAGRRLTQPMYDSIEPARLKLLVKHAKPVFGTDFDVIAEVKNEGDKEAHVKLTLQVTAVTYNSLQLGECQKQIINVTVPSNKAHKEVMRLRYEDYAMCATESHLLRVKALVEGEQTPMVTVDDIQLSMPELIVQIPGDAVVRKPITAYISFTNPLPAPLKGGVFTVEGAGLLSTTQIRLDADIPAGQKVSEKITFSPVKPGMKRLLVEFHCDRLHDVKGVATVIVRKKSFQINYN